MEHGTKNLDKTWIWNNSIEKPSVMFVGIAGTSYLYIISNLYLDIFLEKIQIVVQVKLNL